MAAPAIPRNPGLEPPVPVHDLAARLMISPLIGIGVASLVGGYRPLAPGSPAFWLGTVWFAFIPFAIWSGARSITVGRRHWLDRIAEPARATVSVAVNTVLAGPAAWLLLRIWYALARLEPDPPALLHTAILAMAAAMVITHTYETMFLAHGNWSRLVDLERLERARVQAELHALQAQIDPHFLFNSLNALSELIETDPERAAAFNENLAGVYRYILSHKGAGRVPLSGELHFAARYVGLLQLRFDKAIQYDAPPEHAAAGWSIPPLALQLLVENAVKHNRLSEAEPLSIRVRIDDGFLVVENDHRPRGQAPSGIGLKNLDDRYLLLLGRGIRTEASAGCFTVRAPLWKS